VLVVSAGTSSPIEGAEVRIYRAGSAAEKVRTDGEGRVTLPRPGSYDLEIRAPDHRSLKGRFELDRERTIALEPAGTLEIRFVGEKGDPVSDVVALLLPPPESGQSWGREWRAEFDSVLGRVDPLAENLEPIPEEIPPARSESASAAEAGIRGARGIELDVELGPRIAPRFPRQQTPRIEWKAISDAGGIARWEELPAAEGYRWGLLSPHTLDLFPPHEEPEFVPLDRGFLQNGRAPQHLSGSFGVRRGETTRLGVTVHDRTGVAGRLVNEDRSAGRGVRVRVFHRTEHRDGTGESLAVIEEEGESVCDGEGRFFVSGIRPGRKRLSAAWDRGAQEIYFALVPFDLAEGEIRDLGEVLPLGGPTAQGIVVFRTERGDPLLAKDLFGTGLTARALLSVTNLTEDAPPETDLCEVVSVEFERPFLLHGLAPGQWLLAADRGFELPALPESMQLLSQDPQVHLTVPTASPAVLPFLVRRSIPVRLVAVYPPGAPRFPIRVDLLPENGASSERVRLRPPRGEGEGETSEVVPLAPGRYEARFHPEGDAASARETNFRAAVSFEVREGQGRDVRVALEPGAALRGLAVGGDEGPLMEATVFFSPARWRARGSEVWIYRARTDQEGRFLLTGLEPGDRLEIFRAEEGVAVGAARSESDVVVRSSARARERRRKGAEGEVQAPGATPTPPPPRRGP
jgi:hypothetical protein